MGKVQVELDELEEQILGIYSAFRKLKSKNDAIKELIKEKRGLLDALSKVQDDKKISQKGV